MSLMWTVLTFELSPLQNMPNVRDHDASVYLRLQGDALSVGGYEQNPIFWDEVTMSDSAILRSRLRARRRARGGAPGPSTGVLHVFGEALRCSLALVLSLASRRLLSSTAAEQ